MTEKEETRKKQAQESLLKLRERVKGNKPKFRRQESWRYKRLKENWRRARGIDNKMRKRIKGWPKSPRVGYRGPREARGLHPSGYKEVLVHNADEVEKVDPETQAVRIAHTVGARKRVEITARSHERGIHILNPREEEIEAEELEVEAEEAAGEPAQEGSEEK